MGFNMEINEEEHLYRAVKRSKKNCLDGDRVTSALYKYDRLGISVDRDGGRDTDDIIVFMRNNPSLYPRVKGIAELTARDCFSAGATVKANPTIENKYHANIFLDESDSHKQSLQALQLADASTLIFFDENIEWV